MELIREAGLNTLLGMGMTFLVLISLSLIIALFGRILNGGIPKHEKAPAPLPQPKVPEKTKVQAASGADRASLKAGKGPEQAASSAVSDGGVAPEIIAVISAAVAAFESEGGAATSPVPGVSGFAVRKIRKSRKHVA